METKNVIDTLESRGYRVDTAYKKVYVYSPEHKSYLFYCCYQSREDLIDLLYETV